MNRQWEEELEEESSCTKQREGAQPESTSRLHSTLKEELLSYSKGCFHREIQQSSL